MRAMIFAAGLGSRFKPWTDSHSKALAMVNGKTLLQRNVEYLQQFGIRDIILNVHHFADEVIDAVQKNQGWGSHIQISDERNSLLETGGGLKKAKDFFEPGEKFITCNVDILTDLDINKLLAFHQQHSPLISMAVTDRKTSRYFLFDENNRLCGWTNIKTGQERIPLSNSIDPVRPFGKTKQLKAFSCIVVFEYEIFNFLSFTGKFSLTELYLELAADQLILGYDHSGDRLVDVGKPESIEIAEALFT